MVCIMTCISIHIMLYSIHCWHYYCDCVFSWMLEQWPDCYGSVFCPTPSCSAKKCLYSSTLPAALTYPAFTFTELRMCWDVCHWCLAISAAAHIPHCPTTSATGMELLQSPAWGEATEAGSVSSTSGCGTMGGGSLARSLWQKLTLSWAEANLKGTFDRI